MAIVGIDLGTTNSLISIWKDGKVVNIPNVHGDILTPSVVSIDDNGELLIGKAARERLVTHPERTVEAFKRKMGTNTQYKHESLSFNAVELSTLILKSLKSDAEKYLDESISEAVISVPAYFNDAQRNATKIAGEMAGLKVERLINEPTAAAVAYGLHDREDDTTFIVVDLGGGTFDVSVMELFNDVMEVHASAGDTFLGGEDFTSVIESYFISQNALSVDDLSRLDRYKLRAAANQLKIQLTDKHQASTRISLEKGELDCSITREEFEKISAPLINRLRAPIERVLRDSHISPTDLSDVILVGGATRMPIIRSAISKMFRRLPSCTINPDEVVAQGAAIQAALKGEHRALKDVVLTDVCPYTLGVEVVVEKGHAGQYEDGHFMPILERNTIIPVSKTENIVTLRDNQTQLDIKIFQGESRLVKNNILLGTLNVNVPKGKAGSEGADIRFTYDINGLLEVEATICSTQKKYQKIIEKTPGTLSDKEIQDSLKKLEHLKVHPRETEQNRAAIARAERIYEQSLGDTRQYISHLIQQFELILAEQDLKKADNARKEFLSRLDEFDGNILR